MPLNDPRPVSVVVSEGINLRPDVEEWQKDQLVALTLTRLGLPAQASVQTLSGGWKRRVLLARALVGQPDLLLLDEPTNHLDIETMTWLESLLADYRGAVVFVTHDRVFLQHVATRIVELDRGRLTSWPGDYDSFLAKKEEWLANEAVRHEKFDKRLAEEEAWLRQGIKARRTRNEGRVKALTEMRKERAARRARTGNVRLQAALAERSGQTVFETEGVTKSFGGQAIVRDLSIRVTRGDRIGLIGPNGSGKTTLLRLLIGELAPDEGEVRRGAGVQIVHYDQQREQLDPDRSVFDTIADGSDTVLVNGQPQHVHGYLKQFLFPPERALSPVRALSGGERNRLLLARLFTRPSNVLVLDEPTNDLDIETLELLEEMLLDWPGTLLLVSHDRAFIDNVVTSTLVFQEAGGSGQVAGEVKEYVGGYEDWLRQRPQSSIASPEPANPRTPEPANSRTSEPPNRGSLGPTAKKLTYREREELDALPGRIEALEAEQRALEAAVASPDFYKEGADAITRTLARQEAVHEELLQALARWDELESRPR